MEPTSVAGAPGASSPRTVLVHDYLNQYGGAERVLEAMHDIFPDAPVYTSIYDRQAMPPDYADWDIRPSWMDRLPGVHRQHQWALPLYLAAFRSMRLPDCDLVLSTSSAWAKFAPAPRGAVHVAYIHAPMRFAWNFEQYCERESVPNTARKLLPPFMRMLRRTDRTSARQVTALVANSTAVRDRIRAFWRRDADIVFPPVAIDKFKPASQNELGNYFVVVSRLVPYKRIDIIVEAFNHLALPLVIVGDGRARTALQRTAGPNVRFLGHVSDMEVRSIVARSRAAVFMSEDDFGITQVEAQAAGRPVIALARGGARDSVVPGMTGVWVEEQTVEALIHAVRRFEMLSFDTERLVEHAEGFSTARFQRELCVIVDRELRRAARG